MSAAVGAVFGSLINFSDNQSSFFKNVYKVIYYFVYHNTVVSLLALAVMATVAACTVQISCLRKMFQQVLGVHVAQC
jgi:hypothetical protein